MKALCAMAIALAALVSGCSTHDPDVVNLPNIDSFVMYDRNSTEANPLCWHVCDSLSVQILESPDGSIIQLPTLSRMIRPTACVPDAFPYETMESRLRRPWNPTLSPNK